MKSLLHALPLGSRGWLPAAGRGGGWCSDAVSAREGPPSAAAHRRSHPTSEVVYQDDEEADCVRERKSRSCFAKNSRKIASTTSTVTVASVAVPASLGILGFQQGSLAKGRVSPLA